MDSDTSLDLALPRATDHSTGAHKPRLVLVEYGDLECPDCAQAHQYLTQWCAVYPNDLQLIFRHMPLDQLYPIHPNATQAAIATEAAARQGKFWEMHDAVFAAQEDLSEDSLLALAEQLQLDMDQFEQDMEDASLREMVLSSVEDGKLLGVTATPAFFIDGVALPQPRDYQALAQLISEKLA